MAEQAKGRLSLVHAFRAIAVLFILFGHANKVSILYLNYDWFNLARWERTGGIDFFFIVSGFMIYYLYRDYIGKPGKAGTFMIKRILKIYPLYLLFTFTILGFILVFPQLGDGHEMKWDVIVKSVLLLPTDPILDTTWSLSHVMLFYLLFGLLIYKSRIFKPALAGWIAISILTELNLVPNPQSFLFNFSNLEIVAGSAVAYFVMHYKVKYSGLLVAVGSMGFVSIWFNNVRQVYVIHEPYLYGVFAVLIMLGVAQLDMEKVKSLPRPLSYLGDASYSIFISQLPALHVHLLILSKLNLAALIGNVWTVWTAIILTAASGCAVYALIEKPLSAFLKQKAPFYRKIPQVKSLAAK